MFYLFELATSFSASLIQLPLQRMLGKFTDLFPNSVSSSSVVRRNRSRNFSRIISSDSKLMLIIAPGGATETKHYFDAFALSCRY